MPENISVVSRKTTAAAVALLWAFFIPLSGLAQDVPAHNPDGMVFVRGTVARASASELAIKPSTGSEVMTVKLVQPFHLYTRVAGDLSHVKNNDFVGVTSVKQPDGTELATAVSILPEDLRGVGEGSYMMDQAAGATPSRMTNGNVAASRMTNGTASQSGMSNGGVKGTEASTLTVQYRGGVQKITVPPNTVVHEYQLSAAKLATGDKVLLFAYKDADGSFSSSKGILAGK